MGDASELNASRISLPASRLDHRHPISHRYDSRTHARAVVPPRSALQKLQRLLQDSGFDDAPQRPAAEWPTRLRYLQHLKPGELRTDGCEQGHPVLQACEHHPTLRGDG